MPKIYNILSAIREAYDIVRGQWGAAKTRHGSDYPITGFALAGAEPDTYDEGECMGACALGFLDIHLGARKVNQQLYQLQYNLPAIDDAEAMHEWMHFVLVVAGKSIAGEFFREWKWSLVGKYDQNLIDSWGDKIHYFNDHLDTKAEDVYEFFETCFMYPPYRECHEMTVQFRENRHYDRYVHMARNFYTQSVVPHSKEVGFPVWDFDEYTMLRLLRNANIL